MFWSDCLSSVWIILFAPSCSGSHIDILSFEDVERTVYIIQVVDKALVLVLSAGSELSHAHVPQTLLAELFAAIELIKHLLFLTDRDYPCSRWPLVHLNLPFSLLSLSFLFLAVLLQICRDLCVVLCFELALFLNLCFLGCNVGIECALGAANAAHVLSNEVLLVLRSLFMLLDQVAPLIINLSVLQLLSCDLRRNLGKLFHLEGLLVL